MPIKRQLLKRGRSLCWMALLGSTTQVTLAQSIIAPPPRDYSGTLRADPLAERVEGTTEADLLEDTLYGGAGVLQWGLAHLHPRFLYRILYGTGYQAGLREEKSFIHEVTPGIFLKLGSRWMVDYSPTFRFYTAEGLKDAVDHSVRFSGGTVYQDWSFNVAQTYLSTSQPLIETGAQTDQETFGTSLGATWATNDSLSLQLGLDQNFRFMGSEQAPGGAPLADARTWSTTDWLNLKVASGLTTGLGLSLAYDDVSVGSDMTSEQLLGRVVWLVQRKLTLSISAGGELRQFLDSEAPTTLSPILRASIDYALTRQTTLTLSASHTTSPSYFASQTSESTDINAGIRQRLFGRLMFDLTGGFRSSSYAATDADGDTVREDDGVFMLARLSQPVLKKGTVAIFYSYSDNTSSTGGFSYDSQQVGLELGYKF